MNTCVCGHTFCDEHVTWREGPYADVPKMLHYRKGLPKPVGMLIVSFVDYPYPEDDWLDEDREGKPSRECPGELCSLFLSFYLSLSLFVLNNQLVFPLLQHPPTTPLSLCSSGCFIFRTVLCREMHQFNCCLCPFLSYLCLCVCMHLILILFSSQACHTSLSCSSSFSIASLSLFPSFSSVCLSSTLSVCPPFSLSTSNERPFLSFLSPHAHLQR